MSRASAGSAKTDKRRPAACQRCHKRKFKCSGGFPCHNCAIADAVCTFPARDRNVVVSEAYLQHLQAFAQSQMEMIRSFIVAAPADDSSNPTTGQRNNRGVLSSRGSDDFRALPLTVKHATTESFVSGLRNLSTKEYRMSPEDDAHNSPVAYSESESGGPTEVSSYDYVSLNFDRICENVTIQLPPYPYATQLVSQFESFLAYEYHWYLRQEFHMNLEATYKFPSSSSSRNRIWLCKLLAVLALGESFNSYEPPLIDLSQPSEYTHHDRATGIRNSCLPGIRFFEQALSLFKMPSEEPCIEHVEALNLIALFCYSLNRRKTADMYAGMSGRIACSLMLHVPAATTEQPNVAEHRKRVWWTTFLMDAMVSSEISLRAAFGFAKAEHALPSDDRLSPVQRGDFWDSNIMTAHLKLCGIRSLVLKSIGRLDEADFASYDRFVAAPLQELDCWKRELPSEISFDFSTGVPQSMLEMPSMRSLASCYLRYHQLRPSTGEELPNELIRMQNYIMLIRPMFFKLLAIVLGKVTDSSSIDGLLDLSCRCLEAAQYNMRILITLSNRNLLAKYGFSESLYLFSSIKIDSLSRLVDAIRPLSLIQESQDLSLYTTARDVLLGMANSGNLASRGHMKMLEEIEGRLDVVLQGKGRGKQQAQDAPIPNFSMEGITPWIDSIGGLGSFLDSFEFPHMPDAL